MNYKAIGKFLLIEPIKEELKNSLGMKVSANDDFQIRYRKARALKVGSLVDSIKEGDIVYFDKSGNHEVIVDGRVLSVVLERDIALVESECSSS
jgi:co-chaperonin GroES (HSP10)